jgi:hypothetical protein
MMVSSYMLHAVRCRGICAFFTDVIVRFLLNLDKIRFRKSACGAFMSFVNIGTVKIHTLLTIFLSFCFVYRALCYNYVMLTNNMHTFQINLLNAELNPTCHLLALLGGATIVVVSRLTVRHQVKSHLPFASITRRCNYSSR